MLDVEDVRFAPKGLLVQLRHSKTDQLGRGRQVGIDRGDKPDTCPVRTLKAWITCRGEQPGPLFLKVQASGDISHERLGPEGIARAIKRGVKRIGLNAHLYAGHSLRSGFVTAAAENGASELAIMKRTGHRSVEMVHRYFRPLEAFSTNPLQNLL